jgi:hypothetical protein
MKCTIMAEFLGALGGYDWAHARIGRGPGTLFTVTGVEGAMKATPIPVGLFL